MHKLQHSIAHQGLAVNGICVTGVKLFDVMNYVLAGQLKCTASVRSLHPSSEFHIQDRTFHDIVMMNALDIQGSICYGAW